MINIIFDFFGKRSKDSMILRIFPARKIFGALGCLLLLTISLSLIASETILVLPLRTITPNTEGTPTPPAWLAPAFSIVLSENLHGQTLTPIAPEDIFLLMEEKGKQPEDGISLASSLVLARDLEVDLVLAGRATVLPSGKLAIWVYLIQTDPLRELTRFQRTFPTEDTPWILQELMEAVSANLEERPAKKMSLIAPGTMPILSGYVSARMETDPILKQKKLQEVLSQEPDFPEATYHLARSLYRSGQDSKAQEYLRALVRKDFRYTGSARVLLGLIALRNNKLQAARIHLEQATMIENTSLAHLALAYLAKQEGKENLMSQELNIAGALGATQVQIQGILEGSEVVP